MSDAPKRRRLRFSLRTLFVVVTVIGGWLGWNLHQVKQRKVFIESIPSRGVQVENVPSGVDQLPIVWQLLGARRTEFNCITLPKGEFTDDEIRHIKDLFPDILMIHSISEPRP